MKRTGLLVRVTGLGEAQAEGAVAILAFILLAIAAGALAHWLH